MRVWPFACVILALGAAGAALAGPASSPTAASAPTPAPTSADARLKALYEREWVWRMKEFPGDDSEDAPIADRLPQVDAAAQNRRLAYWQGVRRELDAIAERDLSPDEAVNA